MSERLIIRLASQPNLPISWLVYDDKEQEVMASGVLNGSAELDQITTHAANRVVDVLVPGAEVGYFEVTLPKANRRQAIKAVPYMLEDELASSVESLHFVYAKAQGDTQGVYVCQQHTMTMWLAQLATAQIKPKHLVADYLALPLPGEKAISVLQFEQSVIIRQDGNSGQSVELSWLPMVLTQLTKEQPPVIEHFGIDAQLIDDDFDWQEQPSLVMPMQQLAMGSKKLAINMLSGEFTQTTSQSSNLWQIWRSAAAVAVVAMTVFFANIYLQAKQLEQERDVVKQQIESIYRQLNPQVKRVRIGLLKKQMTRQLANYGESAQSSGMLVMLTALNNAFKQVPELTPLTIKYDNKRQELRLQADAKNYQQFDKFKQILFGDYTVTPGAINNDGNKVNGSLTIKATS